MDLNEFEVFKNKRNSANSEFSQSSTPINNSATLDISQKDTLPEFFQFKAPLSDSQKKGTFLRNTLGDPQSASTIMPRTKASSSSSKAGSHIISSLQPDAYEQVANVSFNPNIPQAPLKSAFHVERVKKKFKFSSGK